MKTGALSVNQVKMTVKLLKSMVLVALFWGLTLILPVQASNRYIKSDFEELGAAPYHAKPNGVSLVSPTLGAIGWQLEAFNQYGYGILTPDIKRQIKVWNGVANSPDSADDGFFVELNPSEKLYHPLCLHPGETVSVKFTHRGSVSAGARVEASLYWSPGYYYHNYFPLLFNRVLGVYSATGTAAWDYWVTPSIVPGDALIDGPGQDGRIWHLGFKSLEDGPNRSLLGSVEVSLPPAIDGGRVGSISFTHGQPAFPLRVNGVIPTGTILTIPIVSVDSFRLDGSDSSKRLLLHAPRFYKNKWLGSRDAKKIFVTNQKRIVGSVFYDEWLVTLLAGVYDGHDPNNYVYLPVTTQLGTGYDAIGGNELLLFDSTRYRQEILSGNFISGVSLLPIPNASDEKEWVYGNAVCGQVDESSPDYDSSPDDGFHKIDVNLGPLTGYNLYDQERRFEELSTSFYGVDNRFYNYQNKSSENHRHSDWASDTSQIYTTETLQPDTRVLNAYYRLFAREGDIRSYTASPEGAAVGLNWSAADKLNARDWSTRKIYTTKDRESTVSNTEVLPLEWAFLTNEEKSTLNNDEKYLDYIKGDRTREMHLINTYPGGYPNRSSVLGEAHSNVVAHKGVVYAQTGEGMLHAFDQATGVELWAYLPKALLPLTNISERRPSNMQADNALPDDDIAPLMTGKIALVKIGQEMVLLGSTGGLQRTVYNYQQRTPSFYAITVETAAGVVPSSPLIKWVNYGRCNDGYEAGILLCGQEAMTSEWKIGYLSKGAHQAVALISNPQATSAEAIRHSLQIFSVATGEVKILSTSQIPRAGKMTSLDFVYETEAFANYPTQKAIKEVYAGDTAGYIWRVSLSGLAFEDIKQINPTEYISEPAFGMSFESDGPPISQVVVWPAEKPRGGVADAPVGRMIFFGTGNHPGIRKLNTPMPDNGPYFLAAYFDATVQGAKPVTYANLIPRDRYLMYRARAYDNETVNELSTPEGLNKDINYSDVNLGWKMALTEPVFVCPNASCVNPNFTPRVHEQLLVRPHIWPYSTTMVERKEPDIYLYRGGYYRDSDAKAPLGVSLIPVNPSRAGTYSSNRMLMIVFTSQPRIQRVMEEYQPYTLKIESTGEALKSPKELRLDYQSDNKSLQGHSDMIIDVQTGYISQFLSHVEDVDGEDHISSRTSMSPTQAHQTQSGDDTLRPQDGHFASFLPIANKRTGYTYFNSASPEDTNRQGRSANGLTIRTPVRVSMRLKPDTLCKQSPTTVCGPRDPQDPNVPPKYEILHRLSLRELVAS